MIGVLNRISSWFGSVRNSSTAPAPGAEPILKSDKLAALREQQAITYSAQLIGRLHGDHVALLDMYQAVLGMLAAGNYGPIAQALVGFKSKFDVHVLNENLRFYCYVEQKLKARPEDLALIRGFRKEMNTIARDVVAFVRKYSAAGITAQNRTVFESEFRQMGARLVQRIEREEQDLYPLYQE